ncbi:MFS transporter [Gordonia sp. NB41Y]|uniref:MFS transporter n=1 Tax=Gordonia sp. NB41Y TaxID=875808 RepID=UPI0006B1EE40|nr:MFS transporter [Gordonia sp. NB41Y]KOY50057.1 transporter [Gordonia sp. NB41Y]WLP91516.1 MFS transporter [Gordonia sp. NB41Y]
MSATDRTVGSEFDGSDSVPDAHPRAAVTVLCAAGIVVALMQTIIVPLIPQLPGLLHAAPSDTTWALTITLLTGATITPIGGRLGDMYGKRRMLLASMGCVSAGSVICALSDSLIPFLVGRGMQGLGFGTIALGISVMRDIVPPRHLGSAVGTMSASLGIGGALGLPVSAAVAQGIGWHALFWLCAVAGVAGAIGIRLTVPESRGTSGGRFDLLGAIGLAVVLTCLLLPLSKGAGWGWSSPMTLGMFAAFLLVGAAWSVLEWRHRNPLIDLRVALDRPVLLTNVASVATGFAFYSSQLMPIQVLMAPTAAEYGLGYEMLIASLILAPSGVLMFVFSHVSARITDRFGPRVSLAIGGGVLGTGYLLFVVVTGGHWAFTWWLMLIMSCLVGAGLGIAYSAMPALIMRAVPVAQTGEANGVNALMRVVGTSASAAVVGMILTWATVPVTVGGAVVAHVPGRDGYLLASAISLAACVVAAAIALAIPTVRRPVIEDIVDPADK